MRTIVALAIPITIATTMALDVFVVFTVTVLVHVTVTPMCTSATMLTSRIRFTTPVARATHHTSNSATTIVVTITGARANPMPNDV